MQNGLNGTQIEEIKYYLEGKNTEDMSSEQILYLYRDISEKFLDGALTFDLIDDGYDGMYIICSVYISRNNIDGFSAVYDRDCLWGGDDVDKFANYIAKLYNRGMQILSDCNQKKGQ